MQKGILVLEDGTAFEGISVGAAGMVLGEVVFNTSMTGYQEILTDPSYVGQIVTMTYPLIGNYGINEADNESAFPAAAGFVAREIAGIPSNWRSSGSLANFLRSRGVMALVGVDTRALTRQLRSQGTMRGVILAGEQKAPDLEELARIARENPCAADHDPVRLVTAKEPYTIGNDGLPVILWDLGAKGNIARSLLQRGCRVTVVPAWTSAETILALNPAGIMLSNGPGDPKQASYVVSELAKLLPRIPTFGICLGHQILGLALGGETYKLKFGHRGGNHPVKDLSTGRVYITSQNHGYAVDADTLDKASVGVSHVNLNDGTVEGLQHRQWPVFSVQYHPEASPGPHDSDYLFDRFVSLIAS